MKPNKTRPFVVGITGGVGSGKSRLSSFASRAFKVRRILADDVGRELMAPGKSVYRALVAEFGKEILAPDGSIDRKRLSEICFRNEKGQEALNRIEHPLIREEILKRIGRTRQPAVLLEAALLSEGRLKDDCDEILFVFADRETRIGRLMNTRGYSREKCERIMALQKSDGEFRTESTAEIGNSGAFSEAREALTQQLLLWGVPKR